MMRPILVTGGAGYIGSHFVAHWREAGGRCVILDDLSRGRRQFAMDAELVVANIADADEVARVCREYDIDVAVHFAAFAYVGESCSHPALYYENNIVSGLAFLQGLRRGGVSKLVFSSSCATYGEVAVGTNITEATPQNPVNPYGRTKAMFEQVLRDYDAAYGLKSIALRYFNAAGCSPSYPLFEAHDPETHLIPLAIRAATTGKPLNVFGNDYPTPDGSCIRDFVHVDDLASAHAAAVRSLRDGSPSLQINLGSGKGTSVLSVLASVGKIVGSAVPTEIGARRPGDPSSLVAGREKAAEYLKWQPRYTNIDEIVRTAYAGFSREAALSRS